MWKFKAILIVFLSVLMVGGLAQVSYAKVAPEVSEVRVISISGNISWIDVKLGKLRLELDASRDRRDPIEYSINKDATRVTNSTDKKFLKLEDLRVGQHVIVEFNHNTGEEVEKMPIAQKIIVNPMPEAVTLQASRQESTSTTTTTTTSTTTK